MALSFLMFFSFHSHQPCPRYCRGTASVEQERLKVSSYSNSSVRAAALLRSAWVSQSISASGGGGGATHFGGIIDAVELHRGRARMIVDDDHT